MNHKFSGDSEQKSPQKARQNSRKASVSFNVFFGGGISLGMILPSHSIISGQIIATSHDLTPIGG